MVAVIYARYSDSKQDYAYTIACSAMDYGAASADFQSMTIPSRWNKPEINRIKSLYALLY